MFYFTFLGELNIKCLTLHKRKSLVGIGSRADEFSSKMLMQEGGPLPGPFMGSCLTLGNELSERPMCWQSKRLYWEGVPGRGGNSSVRGPRKLLCHMAHSLRLYGNGVSLKVISGQSSCMACTWSGSRSFLVVSASLSQDGFQPSIPGGWSFLPSYWPLPNSSC